MSEPKSFFKISAVREIDMRNTWYYLDYDKAKEKVKSLQEWWYQPKTPEDFEKMNNKPRFMITEIPFSE